MKGWEPARHSDTAPAVPLKAQLFLRGSRAEGWAGGGLAFQARFCSRISIRDRFVQLGSCGLGQRQCTEAPAEAEPFLGSGVCFGPSLSSFGGPRSSTSAPYPSPNQLRALPELLVSTAPQVAYALRSIANVVIYCACSIDRHRKSMVLAMAQSWETTKAKVRE